jgi:hypothetical protein
MHLATCRVTPSALHTPWYVILHFCVPVTSVPCDFSCQIMLLSFKNLPSWDRSQLACEERQLSFSVFLPVQLRYSLYILYIPVITYDLILLNFISSLFFGERNN